MSGDRRINLDNPSQNSIFLGQQLSDYDMSTGDLMSSVVSLYMELLELEVKLGNNVEQFNNKNVADEFKSRLEKIGKRNLRDLFSKLQTIVTRKREEYRIKVEREENDAYEGLIGEFLTFSELNNSLTGVLPDLNVEYSNSHVGMPMLNEEVVVIPDSEEIIHIR